MTKTIPVPSSLSDRTSRNTRSTSARSRRLVELVEQRTAADATRAPSRPRPAPGRPRRATRTAPSDRRGLRPARAAAGAAAASRCRRTGRHAVRQLVQEQVLRDAHLRHRGRLLGDHGDAAIEGVPRAPERARCAVQRQRSLVGRSRPRQYPAQGRLPGTVLAGEAEDLTGPHLNADAVERAHGAVALRDCAPDEHDVSPR